MITCIHPDSKDLYFGLDSTYLCCAIITEDLVGLPQTCIIQSIGNMMEGNHIPEACLYKGIIAKPGLRPSVYSKLISVQIVSVQLTSLETLSVLIMMINDDLTGIMYPRFPIDSGGAFVKVEYNTLLRWEMSESSILCTAN